MGVEVSHDDVATTGVEKEVKSGYEIGRPGGVRGVVDVDVDEDLC